MNRARREEGKKTAKEARVSILEHEMNRARRNAREVRIAVAIRFNPRARNESCPTKAFARAVWHAVFDPLSANPLQIMFSVSSFSRSIVKIPVP
jgi:hypothetical protein